MSKFTKADVNNFDFDTPIADGKTKKIWQTVHPGIVAFEQKPDLVMANGTSVMTAEPEKAAILVNYLNIQNNNIFNYLNSLGFATTYQGFKDGFLFHKECAPLKIEFVVRFAACDNASLLKREPEKYALWDESSNSYNTDKANRKYFNEDGTIITFASPILESFHKYPLVITENGIDMIPESKAKEHPRYFRNGKMTEFMNEDPILITPPDNKVVWHVHNQKKPVVPGKPLAIIDRRAKELYDAGNGNIKFVRRLDQTECISYSDELGLQRQTLEIAQAIDYACRNTMFKKTEFDGNGNIVFLGEEKPFNVIDIKLEYGITADGYALTDDIVTSNARFAWGGLPTMSFKKMFKGAYVPPVFQNANDLPEHLLTAAMFTAGTEHFSKARQGYLSKNIGR
ncbi:MAG: hypothetical protein FWG80_01420 [Alphaproteobacteria bacterium]|nr:hypothetical protein [Alphaproteobacteria bacterium]